MRNKGKRYEPSIPVPNLSRVKISISRSPENLVPGVPGRLLFRTYSEYAIPFIAVAGNFDHCKILRHSRIKEFFTFINIKKYWPHVIEATFEVISKTTPNEFRIDHDES